VIKFLTNNGTLNEWMRITSAGNVGIHTQTPTANLDVAGTGNFTSNTGASVVTVTQNGPANGIALLVNSTGPASIVANGSDPNAVVLLAHATDTTGGTGGTGVAWAISGRADGPNSVGVRGFSSDTTQSGIGVLGRSTSPHGVGVFGNSTDVTATTNGPAGVQGNAQGPNAFGVLGFSGDTTGTGTAIGVFGQASHAKNIAGEFDNEGTSCNITVACLVLLGIANGTRIFGVTGNGNVLTLGNVGFVTPGSGVIFRSPNGLICKLFGIDNTGAIISTAVACPAGP
jgi:hypothetical protein